MTTPSSSPPPLPPQTPADYLWDSSIASADAELVALERALAPLRYRATPLHTYSRHAMVVDRISPRSSRVWLRAAASLALLIVGAWALSLFTTAVEGVGSVKSERNRLATSGSMIIVATDGQPRLAGRAWQGKGMLRAGQWVETDATSRAEIEVAGFGRVQVEGDSRVRLVHVQSSEQRLELAQGTISAFITAPPRLFVVDTPAAAAVDLGCAYRMSVNESGDGQIEVTSGWVSMESSGDLWPSIVPRGAMCVTRKGRGPGTPFYADAPATLIRALEQFDFEHGGEKALRVVLSDARHRDSLSLWHLLARTNGEPRVAVFDRLSSIEPPPAGVTRAAIMRGDAEALLVWRDVFIWSPAPPKSRIDG